jgi:amino acid adenylation domain-containing protein
MTNQIFDLLELTFKKYNDKTAVVFNHESISYSELGQRVNTLANLLRENIPSEKIVAVSCNRSIETILNICAILAAGKTYLPLDFDLPDERLRVIVSEAKVDYFLPTLSLESVEGLGLRSIFDVETSKTEEIANSAYAYVLFTSGSTGVPKGVCMPHKSLINLVEWQAKYSKSTVGFNTLQFAKLTFDVSFQEIFCTLSNGGTLFLTNDDTIKDPYLLLNFIEKQNINRLFLPFIALQGLANAANAYQFYPSSLKEIITAGEQLKINKSIRSFFSKIDTCEFFNQYGPTESHVITQLHLKGDPSSWDELPTIGTPIQNARVDIVDQAGNIISKPNEIGELYLSGDCLADGYLNKEILTAQKFTIFSGKANSTYKVYKSGDLGYWNQKNEIVFIGRKDDQVKINGFRVEYGEIELAASKISGIDECAVVTDNFSDGQLYLKLYYTSSSESINEEIIRNQLSQVLPGYMIPSKISRLEKIPKTTSGKVDRKKLSITKDDSTNSTIGNMKAPRLGLESNLAVIWNKILPEVRVARESNFFDLGGSSILAQKLSLSIKSILNIHFPVALIYQYPSVKSQAEYLSKGTRSGFQNEDFETNENQSKVKDIAIIAFSGKFPGANDTEEFWQLIKQGKEGITFFTEEDLDPLIKDNAKDHNYVKARGIIKDIDKFDYEFFGLNPKIAAIMDPQQRLFMEISYEAMEKAGWIASKPDYKIGVFAGTNNNTYYTKNILFDTGLADVFGAIQVMSLNEKDYVASRTAYQFNLKGPAVSVHSACSTSLLAVAQAVESIRNGQCTAALAGGSSVTFPVNSGQRYEEGAIFSNDGHCRPFDAGASGTTFSDGAGVVLLKDYDKAVEDGDEIFAVIKGVGVNNDGSDKASFSSPSILGQADAVRSALKNAQISPDCVGYIEAHGTATPIGDPIEIEALKLAFGSSLLKNSCAIGSVKSNIGHLTAASGIAGLIKTVYALYEKTLPASLRFESLNPQINFDNSPFYVQSKTQEWRSDKKRVAGVSSFGIGGTNVHIVLEEYISQPVEERIDQISSNLVMYSAKSESSLLAYADKLGKFVEENHTASVGEVCANLQKRYFNYGQSHVLAFHNYADLKQKLKKAALGQFQTILSKGSFDYPVFMFPGQGSQYVGMGKSLLEKSVVYKREFEICCNEFNKYLPISLQSVILEDIGEEISNTKYTQPAVFAVSYALSKTLISMGIQPAALCGHSIGEYLGAHLAGVFSFEDAIKIVAYRGKLISELPGGSMLSIKSQPDIVKELLPPNLSIAAFNSPNSCVVSGDEEAINAFKVIIEGYSIACRLVQTSHAFHSHMMDDILEDFAAMIASVDRNKPKTPIMSTQTGKWLTDNEAQSVEYWTSHIRNSVNFSDAFNVLTEELPQAFYIEVGPDSVLNTLGLQHARGRDFPICHTLSKRNSGDELDYLHQQLGILVAKGAKISLVGNQKKVNHKYLGIPTYAFDKKLCWTQKGSSKNPEFIKQTHNPNNNSVAELLKTPLIDFKTTQMTYHQNFSKFQSMLEDASGIEITRNELGTTFLELGLDSLVLTQLAFSIKKEFGVQLSFRQLNESHDTPKAVLDYLTEHSSNEAALPTHSNGMQNKQLIPTNGNSENSIQLLQKQLEALSQQFANLQNGGSNHGDIPAANTPVNAASDDSMEELQKPFGAIARIERHSSKLSATSLRFLKQFEKEYTTKTIKSKSYAQEHRKMMADPRVVTGFKPVTKELVYPIVTEFSKGSRLRDIDGNEYLDWLNGFGSNMFGYSPDFIVQAVKNQLDNGYEIGPQHVLAGEVTKLICKLTKNERIAFCNTGSEAVLGAMRIARTVSSKSYIVSFTGSYHGIVDEALVRGTKSGKTYPASPGILSENVQQIIVLEYGSDEALRVIKERAGEIAGILVEPVQSRRPEFVPIEFLKELRSLTESLDICLIFDEVITGFRAYPGGIQEAFGITADLVTYGKVVGGGMPIGVIGGKSKWMDALDGGYWQYGDDSIPPAGVTYFAGTFVRHPFALAAAKASLLEMERKGPSLQEDLSTFAGELVAKMNEVFEKFNTPYYAVNYRSLWKIKTKVEFPYWELLFTLLRNEGIHIWENFPCFITAAHVSNDISFTINKLEKVLTHLIENELVSGDLPYHQEVLMDINHPPFLGAKISLDEDGNPCWIQA